MDAQFMHVMQNMHQWYEICINLENTIMNNDIWKCKFVNIEHRSVPATNWQLLELSYYYQLDTYNFPLPLLATVKVRKTLQK